MVRSLWTAATGMNAQQTNVDTIANNLANVNTMGIRHRLHSSSLCYIRHFRRNHHGERRSEADQLPGRTWCAEFLDQFHFYTGKPTGFCQ